MSKKKEILVTGGLGYIGSHMVLELAKNDYEVVILDNCANSDIKTLSLIRDFTQQDISFYKGDLIDPDILSSIFKNHNIEIVAHFAALKSVSDSVKYPQKYYKNNFIGTMNLLELMNKNSVYKILFSSSATVYGKPDYIPLDEMHPLNPINPYGSSKVFIEKYLSDLALSDSKWSIVSLRYFNPLGAHQSGLFGENLNNEPTNIMPILLQAALKQKQAIKIFGSDYETSDGTGVRDYIHIDDLIDGHMLSINFMKKKNGYEVFNLGSEKGHTVLEIIKEVEKVSGRKINYQFANRRKGDVAICIASTKKAKNVLNWQAKRDLNLMCVDSWNSIKKIQKNKKS